MGRKKIKDIFSPPPLAVYSSYYAAFLGWLISDAQWKISIHGTNISNFFLFYWVIFAPLDPDPYPATQINAGPDPQPRKRRTWLEQKYVEEKTN
jgi:hypothetical protein